MVEYQRWGIRFPSSHLYRKCDERRALHWDVRTDLRIVSGNKSVV